MSTQQRLEQLLSDSNWSLSDKEWLLRYVENTNTEELQTLMAQWHNDELGADTKIKEQFSELMWQHIAEHTIERGTLESTKPVHRIHFLKTSWFRYAAAIILVITGAAIWYTQSAKSDKSPESAVQTIAVDIAPGGNRAILTVGNSTINLSNNKTGIAVGNAITYNDGERIADAGQQLMLTTPRGGQYQATLPDGSKVWLNAASSIKFPSKFTGNIREVEVTGEAYLEVAQNAKQPFYVHTRKTSIQVLGTSFNINSYADEEEIKTTLIEGSVKIDQSVILKPGQQAVISSSTQQLKVVNADIKQTVAWKNGAFNFDHMDLSAVMRQLARWYDLDVRYEGIPPLEEFRGELSRNLNLSDALELLSALKVKFRVEGKTLIVEDKKL